MSGGGGGGRRLQACGRAPSSHTHTPPLYMIPPRIADHLLQHLYRWVSSPASQLHHASLHRAVNTLMAKLFAQLVAELRRWKGGKEFLVGGVGKELLVGGVGRELLGLYCHLFIITRRVNLL